MNRKVDEWLDVLKRASVQFDMTPEDAMLLGQIAHFVVQQSDRIRPEVYGGAVRAKRRKKWMSLLSDLVRQTKEER